MIGRIALGMKKIGITAQDSRKTAIINIIDRIALGQKKVGLIDQESVKIDI